MIRHIYLLKSMRIDNNPRTFAETCDAKMPTRGRAQGGEVGKWGDVFPSDGLILLMPIPLFMTLIRFMMLGSERHHRHQLSGKR